MSKLILMLFVVLQVACLGTGEVENTPTTNNDTQDVSVDRGTSVSPDSGTNADLRDDTNTATPGSPELSLLGDEEIYLKVGDVYSEAGGSATDDQNKDISDKIETAGIVDVETEGKYEITYSVKDDRGLVSETLVRTVWVNSPIRHLLYEAEAGLNTEVQYIVSGDSTRDNSYSRSIPYYAAQLRKINVELLDNARSGQRGEYWENDFSSPNVSEAISATSGTGANTIMELSLGLNDSANIGNLKTILQRGIDKFLAAKPDAQIFLVTPVPTLGNGAVLISIYEELAAENNFPLVYSAPPLEARKDEEDRDLYFDGTHPNSRGSHRLIDYLFSEIMLERTSDKARTIYADENIVDEELWKAEYLAADSYIHVRTGELSTNGDFTATNHIPVEVGASYHLKWTGKRTGLAYYNAAKEPIIVHYEHAKQDEARYMGFSLTDLHVPNETYFSIHEKDAAFIRLDLHRDLGGDPFDASAMISLKRVPRQ